MNNNVIYEQITDRHPEEVITRVKKFKELVTPFMNDGFSIDLCCGNCEIGEIFDADAFYDFYTKQEGVKHCNMLEFGNVVDRKGDNIIFTHAIEHFANVQRTLNIIRKEFIAEGGKLLIGCPNSEYDNNFKPYSEEIGHYSFHNIQSIKSIAPQAGFRVVFVGELNLYEGFEELVAVLEAI